MSNKPDYTVCEMSLTSETLKVTSHENCFIWLTSLPFAKAEIFEHILGNHSLIYPALTSESETMATRDGSRLSFTGINNQEQVSNKDLCSIKYS